MQIIDYTVWTETSKYEKRAGKEIGSGRWDPIGYPETSVTTNQRHITSHKREYLIYTADAAGNFELLTKMYKYIQSVAKVS